jgi:hypothetical protein
MGNLAPTCVFFVSIVCGDMRRENPKDAFVKKLIKLIKKKIGDGGPAEVFFSLIAQK